MVVDAVKGYPGMFISSSPGGQRDGEGLWLGEERVMC